MSGRVEVTDAAFRLSPVILFDDLQTAELFANREAFPESP